MLIRHTYRIVRKLGQGGMGAVYLADHILLAEPQVLKFLSSELSQDQDLTGRFLREVRMLRQIRHKNVVNAGNLEPAEDGTLFFSMEFVDGPDLRTFVSQSPQPFDVALALEITRGIAEGLGAAHEKGMVHRDIKPENILMGHENGAWVPKIADFGIVATRENSRSTQVGSSLLTPLFAAPEQWVGTPGSELDGRTDLYALGGLLYEMIAGRSVFDAENYQGWSQMHLKAQPQPPSAVRPDLADWKGLDAMILRLLAKDRNNRPHDVPEMLRMLDAIEYVPPAPPPRLPETQQAIASAASSAGTKTRSKSTAVVTGPRVTLQELPGKTLRDPGLFDPAKVRPPAELGTLGDMRTQRRKKVQQKQVPLVVWLAVVAVFILGGMIAERIFKPAVPSRALDGQTDAVLSVAFSANGLSLASASRDNTIQIFQTSDGRSLRTMQDGVESLAFSPDGHTLGTGMSDNTVKIWDASSGQVLSTMQGHTDHVPSVAFSPDGRALASASWDKTIKLWDVGTGQLIRTVRGHTDRVLAVAFSPDGRTLASGGADGTVRFWDPATGGPVRSIQAGTHPVNSVAFSPDGRMLASGSDDTTVKVWDVFSGQPVRELNGHTGPVRAVAFSPDGRMLASGSADGTVRLWGVVDGAPLRVLKAHSAAVNTVAFSPFGHTLASGSADKTVRMWDVSDIGD
jgi:WD40 repeat protein